jgi:3-deoxy-D-manno-octulosonic-acid transferase
MYLLYSFLFTLAFSALLPYFAWQAFFKQKYLSNLGERLGRLPANWQADPRPAIWLHAVSVGETLAAVPLLKALRARFPQHRLIVSTTTATGQAVARSRIAEADGFCYFPFDWRFAVRRALAAIKPQAVILMESELWPNFLAECRAQRIPVLVANGRISDQSFKRSRYVRGLLKPLYRNVTSFLMQSVLDAERAVALGGEPARVSVSGNLKYDIGAKEQPARAAELADELTQIFGLNQTPLIVAGSTSEGEEELLLTAFTALGQTPSLETTRLLIAPRHPERFDQVARLFEERRISYARRSACTRQTRAAQAPVLLLDSMGELAALYQLASVVFVGGSLVPKGGHNILEPALYAKPIIVGPHMENFREISQEFLRRKALVQVSGGTEQELIEQLRVIFSRLLSNQTCAQQLGQNARQAVEANRGATERTVEAVAALLS